MKHRLRMKQANNWTGLKAAPSVIFRRSCGRSSRQGLGNGKNKWRLCEETNAAVQPSEGSKGSVERNIVFAKTSGTNLSWRDVV
jgi:hypothetical protein